MNDNSYLLNRLLDGVTYPGWKILILLAKIYFFIEPKCYRLEHWPVAPASATDAPIGLHGQNWKSKKQNTSYAVNRTHQQVLKTSRRTCEIVVEQRTYSKNDQGVTELKLDSILCLSGNWIHPLSPV